MKLTVSEISQAVSSAGTMQGCRSCARIYVQPVKVPRKNSEVAKTLASAGFPLLSRPYASEAFYVGYDNATGIEGGRGEALAKLLNEHGISCYMDVDED